ncbi:hypothetical protein HQ587_11110 [bacterium]|nr:hypothetical protein [bacterium]
MCDLSSLLNSFFHQVLPPGYATLAGTKLDTRDYAAIIAYFPDSRNPDYIVSVNRRNEPPEGLTIKQILIILI